MKTFYTKFVIFFLFTFSVTTSFAQTLTRGPYLQVGKQDSITIRWRTNVVSNSRVKWGTVFGTYPNIVDSATSTTEHIVRIGGLTASISGSSGVKDFETMLQLAYLYITNPRKDEALFSAWKEKQKAGL